MWQLVANKHSCCHADSYNQVRAAFDSKEAYDSYLETVEDISRVPPASCLQLTHSICSVEAGCLWYNLLKHSRTAAAELCITTASSNLHKQAASH